MFHEDDKKVVICHFLGVDKEKIASIDVIILL